MALSPVELILRDKNFAVKVQNLMIRSNRYEFQDQGLVGG